MLVPPLAFLVRRHLDLHFRAPLLSPPFFALGPMHTLLHVLGEAKPALSHSVHLKQSLSSWSLKKVIGRRRHLYVHVVGSAKVTEHILDLARRVEVSFRRGGWSHKIQDS